MEINKRPEVGEVKTLKKQLGNFFVSLHEGDSVKILNVGERGYDVEEVNTGIKVTECGWDIFK